MDPLRFYKCLADDTRLKTLLLICQEGELCVCELTVALDEIQPKISRHLAQLRSCELLVDRRQGQWVFYRLNPGLPEWAQSVLISTAENNSDYLRDCKQILRAMRDRPSRANICY